MTKKEMISYAVCIMILLWIITSTIEVWIHNANGNPYHKTNVWVIMTSHTTDMVVLSCKGNSSDDYVITVKDIEGNLYAYIDDSSKAKGDVVRITMSGTEIINAK